MKNHSRYINIFSSHALASLWILFIV
jgi:hypothetical protein